MSIPPHLLERRVALMGVQADRGLTEAEAAELVLVERALEAAHNADPGQIQRRTRATANREALAAQEALAEALRVRAEMLQGLRPKEPLPITHFVRKIKRGAV